MSQYNGMDSITIWMSVVGSTLNDHKANREIREVLTFQTQS